MELITVSGLILGMGLGIKLYNYYKKTQEEARRKALDEMPVPAFFPLDESTTCSAKGEPHKWEELTMMDVHNKATKTSFVCMNCGLIQGTQSQFSQVGLEKIKRQQQLVAETTAFFKSLDSFRESELTRRANLTCETGLEAMRFRAGYKAFLEIEEMVAEKIEERKRKLFEEAISKIEGIKK